MDIPSQCHTYVTGPSFVTAVSLCLYTANRSVYNNPVVCESHYVRMNIVPYPFPTKKIDPLLLTNSKFIYTPPLQRTQWPIKKSINHGFPIIRRKSMITHHDTTSQLKPQHLLTRHRLLPSTTYLPPLQMMNC